MEAFEESNARRGFVADDIGEGLFELRAARSRSQIAGRAVMDVSTRLSEIENVGVLQTNLANTRTIAKSVARNR